MRHELQYFVDVYYHSGEKEQLTGIYLDRMVPPHFEKVNKELVEDVKKVLEKRGLRHNDIKKLQFTLDYNKEKRLSEEEEFFYEILDKTESVFKAESATKKKYPDENWNFAICDTPIQKGEGLFFGLNWGGDNIDQQSVYPPKQKKRNWNFVSHSRGYFRDYFNSEIEDLNYSNLCFFRSPDMNHFVSSDWKLAIPLFWEYVDFVNPKWTLMMGSPPSELLSSIYVSDLKKISVAYKTKSNIERTAIGHTGTLFNKYPFGNVPHPQAQISSEARNKIWQAVTDHLKSKS